MFLQFPLLEAHLSAVKVSFMHILYFTYDISLFRKQLLLFGHK